MLTSNQQRRWCHITPDRFVLGLLAVEMFLLMSAHFQWFAFNTHKNWTVLIGLAVLASAISLLLIWFGVSLVFRRPFRFSLRALLVFVLVCAISFNWLSITMHEARKQREAVVAIEKLGGHVGYDYEYDHWKAHEGEIGFQEQPEPPGPLWLRELAGDDFVDSVVSAWLGRYAMPSSEGLIDRPITDSDVEILSEFSNLREVSFEFQPITDSSLRRLAAFRHIRSIGLYGTQITDNGLVLLKGLPDLEDIDIGDTPASLQGIVAIRKDWPSLKVVRIGASQLEAVGGWDRAKEMLPDVQIMRTTQKPGGPFDSESR